jgi:hypothetical protein
MKGKKKNTTISDEFDSFMDADLTDELENDELENDAFGSAEFLEEDYGADQYEENYGEENNPEEADSNIIGTVTTLAKDNKLATAGVLGAVGFGLWKLFGSKEEVITHHPAQASITQDLPYGYEDELLGLDDDDEDDSMEEFFSEHEDHINPMFTPLRFK